MIPHTQGQTNLADRQIGDVVNLECDVVGKYIEKLCRMDGGQAEGHPVKSKLSEEFLMENGFL